MHVLKALHTNISLKFVFLLLPLLVFLFIRQFNLVHFTLLRDLLLQYVINVLIHPALHIILEISKEPAILLFPLDLFLRVLFT